MEQVKVREETLRPHLYPILEEWVEIISTYTNEYDPEDALYWYNERATLSTLAAAITRQPYRTFVLEEYRTEKRDDERGKWPGRADLFFVCHRTAYVAEAKQVWVSISSRAGESVAKITKALHLARKEAVKGKSLEHRRLGIVFVVPRLPLSELDDRHERIRDFISDLDKVDYEAMAYAFPDAAKVRGKYYIYTGVACCIRQPRKV